MPIAIRIDPAPHPPRALMATVVLLWAAASAGEPPPRPPSQSAAPTLEDRVRALEQRAPPAGGAAPAPADDFQPKVIPFPGDLSWAPASYAPPDTPLHHGPFSGEIRVDVPYHYSFANPVDNTISGSSEVFRHNEFQVTQLGFGGDFYYKGVMARLMTQFGSYSVTTPRNDASPARGGWSLADSYRYVSEAYGGYHVDALAGINVQAGIFMSYVGLWSYYNFDNWTYQPSYVSSNTPWFFNGLRVQIYVTPNLKIEPWLVNGWQSYGKFNEAPGIGLQIRWNPREWLSILGNQYFGADTLGVPGRMRIHTDDSVMARLYHAPGARGLGKVAASLTLDAGCELGDGVTLNGTQVASAVSCANGGGASPSQFFLGFMAYLRLWFDRDLFGLTVGGGAIDNPGRYLVLTPPINGATAYTGYAGVGPGNRPVWTQNPGDPFTAWDVQGTFDYMPTRNLTFRAEYTHRESSVPYFTGHGGVTPPNGAGSYVDQGAPGSAVTGWVPDLSKAEDRLTFALLVRL